MEHCRFCGTAVPNFAHFCGHCGAPNNSTSDTPTNISGWHIIDRASRSSVVDVLDGPSSDFNTPTITADFNTPTFISNPSHPALTHGLQNQADETLKGGFAHNGYNPATPHPESSLSEDEEHTILSPDLLLWGNLTGNVQTPANVPIVHGTPNMSGVPVVHGTPPMPAGQGTSPAATAPASPSGAPSPIRPTATGTHPVQPSSQKAAQTTQVQPASPKQKHTRQKLGLHKSGFSYLIVAAITVVVIVTAGIGTMLAIASTHPGSTRKPTIIAKPPHLTVRPSSFNLGTLVEGNKVSLAIVISNSGLQPLQWKADTSGTSWLQVQQGTGLIEPGKFQQCFLAVNTRLYSD